MTKAKTLLLVMITVSIIFISEMIVVLLAQSFAPHSISQKIVFTLDCDSNLYSIDADGSNLSVLSFKTDPWFASFSFNKQWVALTSKLNNKNVTSIGMIGERNIYQFRYDIGLNDIEPAFSPNNSSIAFISEADNTNSQYDIYLIDINSKKPKRLTDTPDFDEQHPSWSPDGNFIVYSTTNYHSAGIYVMDVESKQTELLTDHSMLLSWPSWSPDGKQIAFVSKTSGGGAGIYVIDLFNKNLSLITSELRSFSYSPDWSPDSKQLVFVSKGSTTNRQLYVIDRDGKNVRQITNFVGCDVFTPSW